MDAHVWILPRVFLMSAQADSRMRFHSLSLPDMITQNCMQVMHEFTQVLYICHPLLALTFLMCLQVYRCSGDHGRAGAWR